MNDFDRMAKACHGRAKDSYLKYGPYASLHEAYAVLLEEVDELFQLVKQRRADTDMTLVRDEAIDIAAVALRIACLDFDQKR